MTTLNVRTTTVPLLQGDDYDRLSQLLFEAQNAVKRTVSRLGDADDLADAQEAYNAAAAEAEERARKIELKALPRKEWRALRIAHPPRDGDDGDAEVGFNRDTMGDDLVPVSVVDGQFPSIADRDEFLDALADGDFEKLYAAAVDLNTGFGVDPKARLSSTRSLKSDGTSSSPERAG